MAGSARETSILSFKTATATVRNKPIFSHLLGKAKKRRFVGADFKRKIQQIQKEMKTCQFVFFQPDHF